MNAAAEPLLQVLGKKIIALGVHIDTMPLMMKFGKLSATMPRQKEYLSPEVSVSEEEKNAPDEAPTTEDSASPSRFPEMDELQSEIERRIRDNQKFLDHFLDTDFVDDEDDDDDDEDEIFEEL